MVSCPTDRRKRNEREKGQHCRLGIWTENRATADADEKMREVRNGQGKELALAAQGEERRGRTGRQEAETKESGLGTDTEWRTRDWTHTRLDGLDRKGDGE